MIPPPLSFAGFRQFAPVPSERLGQGFSGMIALLTVSSPYDIVLSVLIGLGRSGALNAVQHLSVSFSPGRLAHIGRV